MQHLIIIVVYNQERKIEMVITKIPIAGKISKAIKERKKVTAFKVAEEKYIKLREKPKKD